MFNQDQQYLAKYGEIEIYKNDIELLEADYISSLLDKEDIKKTNVFFGLLNHLYINLFRNVVLNNLDYNSYDYDALNSIFYNIYIPLTNKYGKTPTLQAFCVMTGISNTSLSEIINGVYQTNGKKINKLRCETVRKWKQTCEAALVGKAFDDNGIGAIFGLKAAHGWSDQQTQQIQFINGSQEKSAAEIQEKYQDIKKPVPMFEMSENEDAPENDNM